MTRSTPPPQPENPPEAAAPVPPPRWRSAAEVVQEALDEVALRHSFPDLGGLRTGIETFDRHAREALMPGALVVVAGESGRGKTALLTQMAVAFSAQAPTLLITLEDRAAQAAKRALANVSRLAVGRIRAGFHGEHGIPTRLDEAAQAIAANQLDFLDGEPLTVEALAQEVWRWQKSRGGAHGVVLIDQLSHLVPSDPRNASYFRARNLPVPPPLNAPETKQLEWQAWFLKVMADRLGLLVVLAHQLNENHGENKPTVSSVRGSRGIVHKADLVVIPWIPREVENPFPGPGQPLKVPNTTGEAWLIIAKGREVPRADEKVVWIGDQQRFADPADTDSAYAFPPAPSGEALEGMNRLLELRRRFGAPSLPAPRHLLAGDDDHTAPE
jgi:replicative DNA helicase